MLLFQPIRQGQDINMTFTSMINRSSFGIWALLKEPLLIYLIKEKPEIKWQRPVTGELGGETTSGFSQLWGPAGPSGDQQGLAYYRCLTVMWREGYGWRASSQGTTSARARWQKGERERSALGHTMMPRNPQIKFNYNYHVLFSLLALFAVCHRQDQHGRGAKSWNSTSCISFVAQFMLSL